MKRCPKCENQYDDSAFSWDPNRELCNGCWNFKQEEKND